MRQVRLEKELPEDLNDNKDIFVVVCLPKANCKTIRNFTGLVSLLGHGPAYRDDVYSDFKFGDWLQWRKGAKIIMCLDAEQIVGLFEKSIKAQLLTYSGLTGEEVNLDLDDPNNRLNSTNKFTSTTPFYVPKLLLPDMSLANVLYRATTVDRSILYNSQYPTANPVTGGALNGKPLGDLLKELLTNDPNLLQTIVDTLAAVNATADNTAANQQAINDLVQGVQTTANNTAAGQEAVTDLLTDLASKGGDAAILQKIDVSLTNMATLGQDIKDMNALYAQKLTDLINELKANGGSESDINQLSTMLESMKTIQAMAGAVSATAMTAEAAAEWAQLGLQSVDSAIEATKLGLDATMASVDLADKATDEIRDLVVGVGAIATGVGTIGTAIGTVMGALTNAVGFYAVRNAIVGVRGELEKLNANIGGPANGDGWFAWLKYQFWGGEPPASFKPTLNDIASAQLQATREINAVQGGNTDLNVEDSIQYIGNGNGSSHK